MTHQTLQVVVQQIKNPAFVPPITDYQLGRLMYKSARDITECTTDEMAHGFVAAAGDCEDAYYLSMMRQAVN